MRMWLRTLAWLWRTIRNSSSVDCIERQMLAVFRHGRDGRVGAM